MAGTGWKWLEPLEIALMVRNGWKGPKMAGYEWKRVETAGFAGTGWKLQEMAGMAGNGGTCGESDLKWLEIMTENVWKCLEIYEAAIS